MKITDEALEAAVTLSTRYISDRYLPDKAIDLVDEAASRVRLKAFTAPPDLKKLEEEVKRLSEEKKAAVNEQDFERAAHLRDEEKELAQKLEEQRGHWQEKKSAGITARYPPPISRKSCRAGRGCPSAASRGRRPAAAPYGGDPARADRRAG